MYCCNIAENMDWENEKNKRDPGGRDPVAVGGACGGGGNAAV